MRSLLITAFALVAHAAAQSNGLLPQYNGNCVACTGPGYYCPLTTLCYSSSSNCNSGCGSTSCYSGPSQCNSTAAPSSNGLLPQYNGNCVVCTGHGYYCPLTTLCYSSSSICNSGCGSTSCYSEPSQCNTTGLLPQYTGNCVACTGPGYYCPSTTLCYSSSTYCASGCGGSACFYTPAQCSTTAPPSSNNRLPQYDGNCVACTGPGYYCPTTTLCYSLSTACLSQCVETCYSGTSQCGTAAPGQPGTLPQYNGNCVLCTGPGYYCASTGICYSASATCYSGCGQQTCAAFPSQCNSTAAPSSNGLLPQYNGNCVACTGPGYYCPLTTLCYSSSSICNSGCGTTSCYSGPSQCNSTAAPSSNGLLPQYNGNCVACTGPGYYCPLTTLCYSSSSICNSGCGSTSCYSGPSQCSHKTPVHGDKRRA